MCYPEPPYVFTDPDEVELAFRTVYLFQYLDRLNRRIRRLLFESAVRGRDINSLLRQLYYLLSAWRRFCKYECYSYNRCGWFACSVKPEVLFKAAEEEGGIKIDPDFAKFAYDVIWGVDIITPRLLEALEKATRCEFGDKLSDVIRGSVVIYLKEPDETSENRCYFSETDAVVPRLIEDGVELYTKSWQNALFLWLAFDGELSLHYRLYYYHEILRKRAEACDDPVVRELYQRAIKLAEVSRRVIDECGFKVTLRGDALHRFARAMINFCHFYRSTSVYTWVNAPTHCRLAESMRHLAEKAEPPLISEHLRQYWRLKAAQEGYALYRVNERVEALETGESLYPPEIKLKREDGEARFFQS